MSQMDVISQMTVILGTGVAGIVGLIAMQQPKPPNSNTAMSSFLPNPMSEPSKYAYELFVAFYTPVWMFLFGCIVVTQYYEQLTPAGYIIVCTVLALPFMLQPIILPGGILMMYNNNHHHHRHHNGNRCPYQVTTYLDGNTNVYLQSISAMNAYKDLSHEELRFVDYSLGNCGTALSAQLTGVEVSSSAPIGGNDSLATAANPNPGSKHQNDNIITSPDQYRPLLERYAFKANVWIATYSFIGNYWYTHYFYSVLQASYTMPNAIRLNNVPIQMYCATHFYFTTYHFFSNCLLRKICTTYQHTYLRNILFVAVIVVFSYFTAFMETLTISSYPYYTFDDRHMAYTVGSAFYGIYFLVSFPAFYFFDLHIDDHSAQRTKKYALSPSFQGYQPQYAATAENRTPISLGETVVQSCGYGMIILFLLDFVRLWLDVPLIVGSTVGK